ncbi:hypothetical protein RSAG8_05636, partial [Rhizoctonia solani AG-8 WAC10335]
MPFREGVKQALKQTKDDLKQANQNFKSFFKRGGSTRPNTPSGTPPHTNSSGVHQQAGDLGASSLGTPPPIQAPTSTPLATQLNEPSDVGNHLEQPSQPSNPMEVDRSGILESSARAPETGPEATSTMEEPPEQVVSQSQASDHAGSEILIDTTEPNSTSVQQSVPEKIPEASGGTSSRRDLKQLATGVVGQVADTLKIGPLKDLSDLLQGFADTYKLEGTVKTEYEALQQRLQVLLKVLASRSDEEISPMVSSKIEGVREFIEGELKSIGKRPSEKQHGRFLVAKEEQGRFLGCCRRIQEYMERLSLDTTLATWRLEEEQSQDRMASWIRLLPSSPSAWYNSSAGADLKRRECTRGTRVDVLANLLGWANSSGMDAVYWLNGMAGTGKTTIAYSVCEELAGKHRLAASFFCSRQLAECNDVNRIFPSIAYQLAQFSPAFRSALSAAIEKDQDAHHKVLTEQFEALIRRPLLAVLAARPPISEGLVAVIDALDECTNKESTRDILDVLLSKVADLPIKFIVSSRPEPQIRDQMNDERVRFRLVLHELDTGHVRADIDTYIREELKPMKPVPSEQQIAALVKKAGILFIYAATAVRYIGYDNFKSDPEDRLRAILAGPESQQDGENDEIDELYNTVLEAALGNRRLRKVERDNMQHVLYTVVCGRDPLTVSGLSELLQIHNTDRVRAVLRPLWSVLHVVGAGELVTTLHASFPDFMFDPARSKAYYCNLDAHNRKLAEHCLGCIQRAQPQFNICGLESSYLSDQMVPDIEERVAKAIPSDLLYACRYWADHVETGKCALKLLVELRDFLSMRLLVWMEVLNLTKQMKTGVECMKLMAKWFDRLEGDEELVELVNDATRFVDTFASNAVSQSTPHIYVSMLTFWPRSGPIAKHYAQLTHGPVQAEGTALDRRQLAHLATWVFENAIDAMAVSPDGRYIALGIGRDVLVVDSSSGRVVLDPLHGHPDNIRSIIFSPNETRVLAGSLNGSIATIIGWDTRTGGAVLGPLQLEGHTGYIKCLTFSPDCTRIATGSLDKTVRLWDAENGKMLRCLESKGSVDIAAFSPDSTRIAAGSYGALQVWNIQTGDTTFGPLNASIDRMAFSPDNSHILHTVYSSELISVRNAQTGDIIHELKLGSSGSINCIGYSPNGRYIVSGSHDRIVWVLDAQHGELVLGPLEGHTGSITSIAFSPDGSRIISGCTNGLVCTWDARQHNLPSHSIGTNSSDILSVKFSSDGKQFVSGSKDGSLSIWDSHSGEMAVGPIKAHTGEITAVDFLNDHVTSGSSDGTMCVCNAQSGEVVLGPLQTDQEGVCCIAYSPNGNLIATGHNPKLNLWDAQTGDKVLGPLVGLKGATSSVQFSPDGTRLVASSWDKDTHIVVWDVSDGTNVFGSLNGHTSWVHSVSYSPNGALIASGSRDTTIIVWDAYTGTKVLGPLVGHSLWVHSVNFSPNSTRLVSGSRDRTIRIWDVQTGEMVFNFPHGHEDSIISVAYSPDGTRILSLCYDGSVRIHDARSTEERALSCSTNEYADWTIRKDGWVVDDQSRLLVWAPGDLRRALMWPRTQVVVAPWGYVRLKFDKSRMGESWAQSYTSHS